MSLRRLLERRVGSLALAVCLFSTVSVRADNECYDVTDYLGRWEGLHSQAVQTRTLYKKNVRGRVQKNNEKILKRWVKAGGSPQTIDIPGALKQAATSCYAKSLELLLGEHVDPNMKLDNDTPLMLVISSVICEEPDAAASVEVLLNKGATLEVRDPIGLTPLMRAAIAGYGHVINILVDHGARLDDKDCEGRTALHWAAAAGQPEAVAALLRRGASPQAKDRHGVIPRQLTELLSQRPLATMPRYDDYNKCYSYFYHAERGQLPPELPKK